MTTRTATTSVSELLPVNAVSIARRMISAQAMRQRMHDLTCYVKETYYLEIPHYVEYEYDVDEHRACRGTKGKHDNDEDYYKLVKLSGSDCRKECGLNPWCTGYEAGTNNRCELWSQFIGDNLPKNSGLTCYTKQKYFD
ncbi:hypothetical protein SARC_09287 [Sphaeroforma arctica JP610]|uniref:Apple domain-containing protein n=1 Tax=Sphaeroforma arctica JP610 TaxID=667725 RepID=A0A0L0FNA5_9EUKA|nr:hypothetical protein SARC_09287 [Sphaeroforma arctica JP610]KNC78275.1 hypothetical protein SARC_09287 [Sphaeroforma arctica JP610]|eukprot:XP_014152177.1 hypothetical protein SARC_09287 [Sphaeroforma arctica JP610]